MINFISIFPLSIVVYPNEPLNLHIFEDRYKQLIGDCLEQKKPFGILPVLNEEIQEYGTLMEIQEVSKIYPNGEMDIKTKGKKIFKTLEHIHQLPDKLYKGAIVTYPKNNTTGTRKVMDKVLQMMATLHTLLKVQNPEKREFSELWSYDIAHKTGLTQEQEYELLTFTEEVHRQEYLRRHLSQVIPVLQEMELLKQKIKMNGHFKNIDGFSIS